MPEARIRDLLEFSRYPVSMETPIGDDEDVQLGDLIEDEHVPAPSASAMNSGLSAGTEAMQQQSIRHVLQPFP